MKKHAHITRATIANITVDELADCVQMQNAWHPGEELAATLFASTGIFKGKIERGVTMETTAKWDQFALWLVDLLTALGEDSAYIVEDGQKAFLLYCDGTLEVI